MHSAGYHGLIDDGHSCCLVSLWGAAAGGEIPLVWGNLKLVYVIALSSRSLRDMGWGGEERERALPRKYAAPWAIQASPGSSAAHRMRQVHVAAAEDFALPRPDPPCSPGDVGAVVMMRGLSLKHEDTEKVANISWAADGDLVLFILSYEEVRSSKASSHAITWLAHSDPEPERKEMRMK